MSDSDSEFAMETDSEVNNGRRTRLTATKKFKTNLDEQRKNVVHNQVPKDVQILVSTSNQFDILQNNEDEVIVQRKQPKNSTSKANYTSKAKKDRVPPIIVSPPTTKKTVESSLKSIAVTNFRLKHASVGIYLYVDSLEDHKKIRTTFKASGICFFSHDLPEDKVARAVLTGLDKMETSELSDLIKEQGFDPIDIKVMTPKKSRYNDHVNYLVYFKRDSTDLKKLYQMKVLNYTVVRWEPYRSSRPNTVTQCRRCQRTGHGTRHCEMPPRCMYCPGGHLSADCTEIKKAYDEAKAKAVADGETDPEPKLLENFKPTCCNCGRNHLASSPECPERSKFQLIQQKLADRNKRNNEKSFNHIREDFPDTLLNRGLMNPPAPAAPTHPMYNRGATYSQTMQNPPPPHQSNNTFINDGNCVEDLFTFEQVNSLLSEMISSLNKCRTKADQFDVITHLAFKYVYGHK